ELPPPIATTRGSVAYAEGHEDFRAFRSNGSLRNLPAPSNPGGHMRAVVLPLLALTWLPSHAEQPAPPTPTEIEQVLAHPLFEDPYMCSEHAEGELPYPGDD